jgi:hypothetical protein
VSFWQKQFEGIVTRQLDKWMLLLLIVLFLRWDRAEWAYFTLGGLMALITGRSGQRRSSDDGPSQTDS